MADNASSQQAKVQRYRELYTYLDISKISDDLMCGICLMPLVEPTEHLAVGNSSCSQLYCAECAKDIPKCPHCRYDVEWKKIEISPSSQKFILKPLAALQVVCNNCKAAVARSELNEHVFGCPVECVKRCGEKVAPRDVAAHTPFCLADEVLCEAHDVKCPWTGPRREVAEHNDKCSYYNLRLMLREWAAEIRECKQQTALLEQRIAIQEQREQQTAQLSQRLAAQEQQVALLLQEMGIDVGQH